VRTLPETSNNHALCCILNPVNTLVQLLHSLSSSSCQFESIIPPSAKLLLSQSQQSDLLGYHLRLSRTSLRRFIDPAVNRFTAINISDRKQEALLYEYPLHWVLLPTKKKTHNRTFLFSSILLKHCRHFDCWNQSLNMRMRVCYLEYHEARLFLCLVLI
jgi:hypothetical protein